MRLSFSPKVLRSSNCSSRSHTRSVRKLQLATLPTGIVLWRSWCRRCTNCHLYCIKDKGESHTKTTLLYLVITVSSTSQAKSPAATLNKTSNEPRPQYLSSTKHSASNHTFSQDGRSQWCLPTFYTSLGPVSPKHQWLLFISPTLLLLSTVLFHICLMLRKKCYQCVQ